MNALEIGVMAERNGLVGPEVRAFLAKWKRSGDAFQALDETSPRGRPCVAAWAARCRKVLDAGGADDNLLAEFEELEQAARGGNAANG